MPPKDGGGGTSELMFKSCPRAVFFDAEPNQLQGEYEGGAASLVYPGLARQVRMEPRGVQSVRWTSQSTARGHSSFWARPLTASPMCPAGQMIFSLSVELTRSFNTSL